MDSTTDILECGHAPSEHSDITTGYGTDAAGKRSCYDCCAALERQSMIETGRATLYLVDTQASPPGKALAIQDWPGKLSFTVTDSRKSKGYGFGGAYPVVTGHFIGPDSYVWSFRNAGNSQIARCKRTRFKWVQQKHGGYAAVRERGGANVKAK